MQISGSSARGEEAFRDGVVPAVAFAGLLQQACTPCASLSPVTPRIRPTTIQQVPPVRLSPAEQADLRAALAELDRGEGIEPTPDEVRHMIETGEWPEHLD